MRYLLTFLLIAISQLTLAQKAEESALNALFSGENNFSASKKSLTIEFLKNGEVFRIDAFDYDLIDWENLKYDDENKQVEIPCLREQSPCIDRKIVKMKSRQPYPRLDFKVNSDDQARQLMDALRSLANII